jgi:ABC-2 type transport system ATP-binding protein
MKKTLKNRNKPSLKNVETVLLMEQLSSKEHYFIIGQEPKRVFSNINLQVRRGESWGICGKSFFEIKLLLEIIANIKSYYDGKCVLVERGMPRNKRIILDHVFYAGNMTMVYNNMNVLEFLMFATAKKKIKLIHRQEKLFEFLIDIGLGYISLTPIKMLTKEEKAVIILIAAAYSESKLVIFNFPSCRFNEILINAIKKISKLITEDGNSFILATKDSLLIENTCSHTAYIANGEVLYKGTVRDLRLNYDKIVLTVKDDNVAYIKDMLTPRLPGYEFSINKGSLLISTHTENNPNPYQIYEKIVKLGFAPQCIKINPKTVQNAYKELERQYDL